MIKSGEFYFCKKTQKPRSERNETKQKKHNLIFIKMSIFIGTCSFFVRIDEI